MHRLFCNHKNEKILYIQKGNEIPFDHKEKIFYCPDCKSYTHMIPINPDFKTYRKTRYSSNPGNISNFAYLGGNE